MSKSLELPCPNLPKSPLQKPKRDLLENLRIAKDNDIQNTIMYENKKIT